MCFHELFIYNRFEDLEFNLFGVGPLHLYQDPDGGRKTPRQDWRKDETRRRQKGRPFTSRVVVIPVNVVPDTSKFHSLQ